MAVSHSSGTWALIAALAVEEAKLLCLIHCMLRGYVGAIVVQNYDD
jgi:hypothetical protein